jgi:hypothetical protein
MRTALRTRRGRGIAVALASERIDYPGQHLAITLGSDRAQ